MLKQKCIRMCKRDTEINELGEINTKTPISQNTEWTKETSGGFLMAF